MMRKIPVLLVAFNRPHKTNQVFQAIKAYQPEQLFVAIDGPRAHVPEDQIKCSQTKDLVSQVDWPCEVKTLYSDTNLGCDVAVPKAIDWFFSTVASGVILEDDCLPSLDFFEFMAFALAQFENTPAIFHINGSNFFPVEKTYFFESTMPICWGWGTWATRWRKYSYAILENYPSEDIWDKWFSTYLPDAYQVAKWKAMRQYHAKNEATNWDYRWIFSVWSQQGICITPSHNLIQNIGSGPDATHSLTEEELRHQMLRRSASQHFFTDSSQLFLEPENGYNRKLAYLLNPAQPWPKQTKFWIGEFLRKIRRKSAF